MALLEIDLNLDLSHSDIGNGDRQQDKAYVRLPDLNADVASSVLNLNRSPSSTPILDLNRSPSSPVIEITSSNHPLFNLNSEPWIEDDSQAELYHEITDSDNENVDPTEAQGSIKNSKNLSNNERRAIYDRLLQMSVEGKLKSGMTNMVASEFSVSIRTVQRIWKQAKSCGMYVDVSNRKAGNSGRKKVQVDLDKLRDLDLHLRTSLESVAHNMNTSKTTIFRRLKSGHIRRHSNALKPFLKEENKISRLQFCISMLEEGSIPNDPIFKGMYNIIHIDEKWFYLTKKSENYYLVADEDDPQRTCKSKNFIGKVMFLVAVARPRFDAQGNELFSGKIGVFPFVTSEPARRSSVNRVAGTLELKPIISVNREVVRSYLIERVLPAIKEKWPREDLRSPIFIQQDNARTHVSHNDDGFHLAAIHEGLDVHLMNQPPNSPDLNVLDLGFFSAIQSLQYKEAPKTVSELVDAVVNAYNAFSTVKSNRIFLTLQLCMIEIMRVRGSHKYKIPHIGKARLEKEGKLPAQIKCDPTLVREVQEYLR